MFKTFCTGGVYAPLTFGVAIKSDARLGYYA